MLVNFGIAVTYPTLISLGIVLSVPVNASKFIDIKSFYLEISFKTVKETRDKDPIFVYSPLCSFFCETQKDTFT